MTSTTRFKKPLIVIAVIGVVGVLSFGGNVSAKKGVCKDGTPPPCKPTAVEEGVNNLSYPAMSTELTAVTPRWNIPADPMLGVHYSYGCEGEETYESFTYPNTSCVDDLGAPTVYLTAPQCRELNAPCYGKDVSRIFWQKVEANDWWADSDYDQTAQTAVFVNWGDNLESNTWSERSVIRVETQPFASLIPSFDPTLGISCEDAAGDASLDPALACHQGFQMWHVSGQGTTEQWGARATDADLPYIYSSPFQIIHTAVARLNLAKIEEGSSTCPTPGGGEGDAPPTGPFTWNVDHWEGTGVCTLEDSPYTAELNVGGKYVYGYNWRMKNVELDSTCGSTWEKAGYWRLTFYAPLAVAFDETTFVDTTAPPEVPAQPGVVPVVAAEEEETDTLYTPVVDYDNNLTYLDICVEGKTRGGGGGPRR